MEQDLLFECMDSDTLFDTKQKFFKATSLEDFKEEAKGLKQFSETEFLIYANLIAEVINGSMPEDIIETIVYVNMLSDKNNEETDLFLYKNVIKRLGPQITKKLINDTVKTITRFKEDETLLLELGTEKETIDKIIKKLKSTPTKEEVANNLLKVMNFTEQYIKQEKLSKQQLLESSEALKIQEVTSETARKDGNKLKFKVYLQKILMVFIIMGFISAGIGMLTLRASLAGDLGLEPALALILGGAVAILGFGTIYGKLNGMTIKEMFTTEKKK